MPSLFDSYERRDESGWSWRERPWTLAALAWCAAWLLAHAVLAGRPSYAFLVTVWGRLPLLVAAATCGWLAARANADERGARIAWLLVTAGFAVLVPGDLNFAWNETQGGSAPAVSVSDLFYLAYFPLILGGLVRFPRVFRGGSDAIMFALDAGIVAIGGGMLLWRYGVQPVIESMAPLSAAVLVDLAYPVGDLLTLLGLATVLLRLPHGPQRLSFLLLALPLVASLIGDTLWMFANLAQAAPLRFGSHVLWLLQPAAFIAAAEHEWRRPREATTASAGPAWQPAFAALPFFALIVGYAVLAEAAYGEAPHRLRALLPGAFALSILVVARQAVAQRENRQLLAEQVRRADEQRFESMVQHASDAILIVDPELVASYASPAARRLLGDDVGTPRTLASALHPDDLLALREYAGACARGQARRAALVLRFGREPGPWVTTETTLTNLLADPKVRGLVLNARDVSERRALEEQLRVQALHDPLSGLPNRELFLDRVARALARGGGERAAAVAVVDIDHFTQVNDGLGHSVGDQVLATTAARIASALSGADSAARIGGDDFGLLLEDASGEDAVRARVERVRLALAQPLKVDGHTVRLTASIGVALGSDADTTDSLMRNADIALQQAQGEGGDCAEVFRADRHGRVVERLALEAQLPQLLERDAFGVAFEPVVRVSDRRPSGVYVRLLWRDKTRTQVPIQSVLAAARESALGVALGRWMRQAMQRDLGSLLRYLPEAAELAIGLRLEAPQLKDDQLHTEIAAMLARLDIAPRNLVLELPESALSPLTGPVAHTLQRLRDLGVSLALGEFGAAHSTFELLDAFRFDGLVLAESLVDRVEAGERPGTLVRAAIATGRSLGMRVVAPNVRSARQLALLAELGCEFAWGEHIAPPMGYEHLLPWLAARFAEAHEARGG